MEKLTIFDFIIIYCKKAKNLVNGISRQPDFKDDNELSITKHQFLPNFLSKFQKHLEDVKNDPIKEQNIDSNETLLPRNVLNLAEAPQGINSIGILPVKSEDTKNDPAEEQNIDFNETSLLGNILNLIKAPQDINSTRMLPIKSKSKNNPTKEQ